MPTDAPAVDVVTGLAQRPGAPKGPMPAVVQPVRTHSSSSGLEKKVCSV